MLVIPERGVSLVDAEGKPFHDPEADAALFNTLEALIDKVGEREFNTTSVWIDGRESTQLFGGLGRGPELQKK